jgi:hypothetical protein
MAVEMVGETTGWSRLGFKLHLVVGRQFSWRVISVHKTPLYYPASTKLSHRLQVCYPMRMLKRSAKMHCKPEIPPSLFSYDVFLVDLCGLLEVGWQFLLIHYFLKCPTLTFGRSCNLRDGQGILLYSCAPTIHKGFAQIHNAIHIYQTVQNPHQSSVTSYRVSRRHISNECNKYDVEEHAVWQLVIR